MQGPLTSVRLLASISTFRSLFPQVDTARGGSWGPDLPREPSSWCWSTLPSEGTKAGGQSRERSRDHSPCKEAPQVPAGGAEGFSGRRRGPTAGGTLRWEGVLCSMSPHFGGWPGTCVPRTEPGWPPGLRVVHPAVQTPLGPAREVGG